MTGPSPRPSILVAVLTLLLTACTASGEGTRVLPIDDVLETGIVVTPDASGTSARLTVTTTIPLACAVIYGPDPSFGAVATDTDMAGGAHREHSPRMTGLEPATEYHYVLQGSDAEGNLYRSDVLTFTTPEAQDPAAERPGENVAPSGTVVEASSQISDAFAAEHAIDGDPATEWSTAGDGDDAAIIIELAEPREVVGFGVRSRAMGDGSSIIERYEVTVDGGEVLGPFEASADGLAVVEAEATGQRFRFDAVTTTGGNTGAVEIEIYARP